MQAASLKHLSEKQEGGGERRLKAVRAVRRPPIRGLWAEGGHSRDALPIVVRPNLIPHSGFARSSDDSPSLRGEGKSKGTHTFCPRSAGGNTLIATDQDILDRAGDFQPADAGCGELP